MLDNLSLVDFTSNVFKRLVYTLIGRLFLVSLQHLATWGLGPEPFVEALAHEITTRRCEFSFSLSFYLFINIFIFEIDVLPFRNGDDEREQRQGGCG